MDSASNGQQPADVVGSEGYRLDEQVGYLLRRANQRHTALFAQMMPNDLTPTQFAALARLAELGPLSQNLLGRHIALDAATIKGVVDRLGNRGLVQSTAHPTDGRRTLISLTPQGEAAVGHCTEVAEQISSETLAPLDAKERRLVVQLLTVLADGPGAADDVAGQTAG